MYFCFLKDQSVFVIDQVLIDHTQERDCVSSYWLEVKYFFLDTL